MEIKSSIFREYDIRGKYPDEINGKVVQEVAKFFSDRMIPEGPVVIAMDVRKSSKELYRAAKKGLSGRKSIMVGFSTTPMFYFLVNRLNAAGGIMITASHNPTEWNGMKMVGPKADPISGKEIMEKIFR